MTDETPGQTAWRLILCDDPAEIAEIEADYGMTQAEAVDDFIEDSCWSGAKSAVAPSRGRRHDTAWAAFIEMPRGSGKLPE